MMPSMFNVTLSIPTNQRTPARDHHRFDARASIGRGSFLSADPSRAPIHF